MASILDQYGIKEVADVTIYEIDRDDNGQTVYNPVLFLDTLKISTIETTAEQTEATGGKGNAPLIIWDYGKEITITLQDALFTPASMAIMFGDQNGLTKVTEMTRMRRTTYKSAVITSIDSSPDADIKYYKAGGDGTKGLVRVKSSGDVTEGQEIFEERKMTTWTPAAATKSINAQGHVIEVNASTFPGTYRLVGETYARDKLTGKDRFFQFIIPQAKMSSTNTLTLEAEGDPSVFDMEMRVLRPTDGKMMELIQYDFGPDELPDYDADGAAGQSLNSVSTYSTSTSSLSGK